MPGPFDRVRRFLQELKRRNVYKVAVAYLAVAFVGIQAAQLLVPPTTLPAWSDDLLIYLAVFGFPLAIVIAWAFEMTPEGVRRTAAARTAGQEEVAGTGVQGQGGLAVKAVVALGLLAAAVVGGWYLTGAGEPEVADPTVAVLPFANLSGETEAEPFVDGMTEQLITELSKLSELTVISRTSVMRYKDTEKPLREIGRELGADVVVEGSIVKADDEVRITAQLIDAERDRHLWADDYRRGMRNVLDIQSEVARTVAREIGVELSPEEEEELRETRSVDPAAHEAYLRGLYYFRQGGPLGTDDSASAALLRTSASLYREAIEVEPDWAEPYAHLAYAYHWLASMNIEPDRYYSLSKEAALQALELDESLSLAHASLAFVLHLYDWDFAGARSEYRRAMELSPNAHHWFYAIFLRSAGEYEEAIEHYRRGIERNPLSAEVKRQLASALHCAGRNRQALRQLDQVIEFDPDYPSAYDDRGLIYLNLGRYEDAIAQFRRAAELRGVDPGRAPLVGVAYAAMGRRDRALEVLRAAGGKSGTMGYVVELQVALGDTESALRHLERALEQRNDRLLYIRCRRWLMEHLGDEPRFQRLLDRIGFPNT